MVNGFRTRRAAPDASMEDHSNPVHVDAFDRTLQKTYQLLAEIMTGLETEDANEAYLALRAVLHALRDRLIPGEAVQLAAQLPLLVRGIYYEGWRPSMTPTRIRQLKAFADSVEHAFPRPGRDGEKLARVVFAAIASHVSAGEIGDIKGSLPHELRELWPASRLEA